MSKEISKNLMCVLLREGIEIWVEEEKVKTLKAFLEKQKSHCFISIDESFINTADIVGIFSAETMEEKTRRKNGQWKDDKGKWHERGERLCPNHPDNVVPYGQSCGLCGSNIKK